MTKYNSVMARWMARAERTPGRVNQLAAWAGTSRANLRHIATGRRHMSAQLAQRIAAASRRFDDPAAILDQRMLCHVCAVCPIANSRP